MPSFTVNFSVPEDVKRAFNETFEGQNKSAVLTRLMREAVEQAQRQRASDAAVKRILARHPGAPVRSAAELDKARKAGRP